MTRGTAWEDAVHQRGLTYGDLPGFEWARRQPELQASGGKLRFARGGGGRADHELRTPKGLPDLVIEDKEQSDPYGRVLLSSLFRVNDEGRSPQADYLDEAVRDGRRAVILYRWHSPRGCRVYLLDWTDIAERVRAYHYAAVARREVLRLHRMGVQGVDRPADLDPEVGRLALDEVQDLALAEWRDVPAGECPDWLPFVVQL